MRVTCLRARPLAIMLTLIAAIGSERAHALTPETVTITSSLASKGPFTGQLVRPATAGASPAIVAMHGCGGLLDRQGRLRSREADWAQRFVDAGYAVLFVDSFTARGVRQICTASERAIFDIAAAAEWLASQTFVDKSRLALIGWSHGAMSVLWAVRPGFLRASPFRTAIAFYPGCRQIDRLEGWRPSVPLTLLIGSADDWTRPGPCRRLAERTGFRFIEYPGAYHGFDAPASRVRMRRGLGAVKGGQAHVGTDKTAREAAIKEAMGILRGALARP
jgi:dienelactone hydrolase